MLLGDFVVSYQQFSKKMLQIGVQNYEKRIIF